MKTYRALLTYCALLFLFSCEKDFNIHPAGANTQMNVNSLFNDGAPVVVFVTQPYGISTPNRNMTPITNAHVQLFENNVYKEDMRYLPSDTNNLFGSYISTLLPRQGACYTVIINAPGYTNASATDSVPVGATVVTSYLQSYINTPYSQQGLMTIVFKDDPYRQNYYRVNMWAGGYQRIINGNHDTSYSFQFYAINGRPADTAFQVVRDGDFFLFSDNGFNGQEKSLPIKFSTIDTSQFQNLTLYAELHTVSPAHYEYFKSLNLYRSTNSSSEPVFIYSNVNNGLGAFVAEHIQSLPIVIK